MKRTLIEAERTWEVVDVYVKESYINGHHDGFWAKESGGIRSFLGTTEQVTK